MEGYADRPALGQRAVEFVTDPETGRTSARAAAPVRDHHLPRVVGPRRRGRQRLGDGPGARCSPATASACWASPAWTTRPSTWRWSSWARCPFRCRPARRSANCGPSSPRPNRAYSLSSIDDLGDAVELVLTGHAPARLVVFDYHPEVDDQREAFDAAAHAVGGSGQPGRCGDSGRAARTREVAAGRTGVRSPTTTTRWRC